MTRKNWLGSIPVLCAIGLAAGCSPGDAQTVASGAGGITMETSRQAAVVLLIPERCPVSGPVSPPPGPSGAAVPGLVAAGAAALVGPLVKQAFDAVSDYLKQVQNERSADYHASGLGALPGAEAGSCLVIARGRIGEATPADGQGSLTPAMMRLAGLAAAPDFYLEARLLARPAGANAMQLVLQPQLVQFARTAALRARDDEKAVGIVVAFRGTAVPPPPEGPPGPPSRASATEGAAAVFALDLGRLRPGTELRPLAFPAPALAMPPSHPLGNLARVTTLPVPAGQVNIDAFVTESAEPNRVLALVSTVLAESRADLQTALTDAVTKAIKGGVP